MEEAGILGNTALLNVVLPSCDPDPFLPLLGTPGATTWCQHSIGKSFRAKHIGPDTSGPGRSESLVGIGAPKVPHRFPPHVHCLEMQSRSQTSATSGITQRRRAKPTRVVGWLRRRSSSFRCSEVRITRKEVFGPCIGASMLGEQGVEQGGYHGRKLESRNSIPICSEWYLGRHPPLLVP
jgi:hypothetical protein